MVFLSVEHTVMEVLGIGKLEFCFLEFLIVMMVIFLFRVQGGSTMQSVQMGFGVGFLFWMHERRV